MGKRTCSRCEVSTTRYKKQLTLMGLQGTGFKGMFKKLQIGGCLSEETGGWRRSNQGFKYIDDKL